MRAAVIGWPGSQGTGAPRLLLVQERDSSSCQVALRDGSRRPELGIREAPRLFVMTLVVFGKSEGGAGFQGQGARWFRRGLGWKVEGYFLFVRRLAWCVRLCVRGGFRNRPQGLFILSLCLSWGWSVQQIPSRRTELEGTAPDSSQSKPLLQQRGLRPREGGTGPVLPQHCTEVDEEGQGLPASPGGRKAYRCAGSRRPPPPITPSGVFSTSEG